MSRQERDDVARSFVGIIEPAMKEAISKALPDLLIDAVVKEAIAESLPDAIDEFLRHRGYSEEVTELVQLYSERFHDTNEDVLKKALRLYNFAMAAREQGHRVAILNSDDEIVHEIIGLEPTATTTSTRKVAG
jgi:hypothetical protein